MARFLYDWQPLAAVLLALFTLTASAHAGGPPDECDAPYCVTNIVKGHPEKFHNWQFKDSAIEDAQKYRADGIPAEVWTSYGQKVWPQ